MCSFQALAVNVSSEVRQLVVLSRSVWTQSLDWTDEPFDLKVPIVMGINSNKPNPLCSEDIWHFFWQRKGISNCDSCQVTVSENGTLCTACFLCNCTSAQNFGNSSHAGFSQSYWKLNMAWYLTRIKMIQDSLTYADNRYGILEASAALGHQVIHPRRDSLGS